MAVTATASDPNVDPLQNNDEKVSPGLVDIPIIPAIGIIYPPPEIRAIVDKTAEFVAKHGLEFEGKIRTKEANNAKFNFLNKHDPYFTYYKHTLSEFQLNPNKEKAGSKPAAAGTTWAGSHPDAKPSATHAIHKATTSFKKKRTIIDLSDPTCPSSALPPFEFVEEVVALPAVDLDTLKITALFVARNGRQFLQSLMQREMKNYLFDFLKPQHNAYGYFNKMIEQYSKILAPSNDMINDLLKDIKNVSHVFDKVRLRFEWAKHTDKERRKEVDEVEKEKSAVSQIDWHEFVIVEVISFREDERANLPPPVTLDQLGARVLAQERYEKMQASGETGGASSESLEPGVGESKSASTTDSIPSDATVRKDYDPKASTSQSKQVSTQPSKPKTADKYLVSPITGEMIPGDQLEQHLKVALLDSRWKEQRQKQQEEKRQQDLMLSTGLNIGTHLKDLAQRRSDIFGPGHEETMIGRKLDEKDDPHIKRAAPVHWESKVTAPPVVFRQQPTMPTPSQATLDRQMEVLQGRSADPNYGIRQPAFRAQVPSGYPQMYMQPGMMMGQPQQPGVPVPGMPPSSMMAQRPEFYGTQHHGMAYYDSDPTLVRMRPDDELVPEEQFLAAYGDTPVNIQVRIPCLPDVAKKNNWQLHGQIEHLTVNLKENISVLKTKLQQSTGIPSSKQKILVGVSRFAKDSCTMAYYNLSPSTFIQLTLKERGGRK